MKRFHLWIVQTDYREDLGIWPGDTVADALAICLGQRGQTVRQRAEILGLSQDHFIRDCIEAKEV